MTEEQVQHYLRTRGYPDHIWKRGTEGVVQRWKDFVAEVEKGYCPDCLIDEYWNDLDKRELVHALGYDQEVTEADERFRALLTATNIKHYHRDRNSDYDFWNYGYPKNASGFFLEEIKRHILQGSRP